MPRFSINIFFINVSGFLSAGVLFIRDPPDPFPNSEVKPYKADDTCCFGGRESRLCRQLKIQKRESIEDQLIKLLILKKTRVSARVFLFVSFFIKVRFSLSSAISLPLFWSRCSSGHQAKINSETRQKSKRKRFFNQRCYVGPFKIRTSSTCY